MIRKGHAKRERLPGRSAWGLFYRADALGGPVLAEAGDQVSLEGEDGDLAHALADVLGQVVEFGLPLGDYRGAVQVQVQQLAPDVRLGAHDLLFPVAPDGVPVRDRVLEYALVIGRGGGEDRDDQAGILLLPRLDVGVQDRAGLLPG